jgi:hypothetical protein
LRPNHEQVHFESHRDFLGSLLSSTGTRAVLDNNDPKKNTGSF